MRKGHHGATVERVELAAKVKAIREGDGQPTWREIAERLSISRSYASELYNDPLGTKARERKDSYAGPCANFAVCGNVVSGSDGPNNLPTHCATCAPIFCPTRVWTRDTIIAAFREYEERWGHAPPANWRTILAPSQHVGHYFSDERMAEAATNTVRLPHRSIVMKEFGSWPAACDAAGVTRLGRGNHAARTTERRINPDRTISPAILAAVRAGHETATAVRAATGLNEGSVRKALRRLTRSGQLVRTGRGVSWKNPHRYRIPKGAPMPVGKVYVVLVSNGEDTWHEYRTQALTPEKAIEAVANGTESEGEGIGAGTYVCVPESLFVTQDVGEITKLAVLPR